MLGLAAFLCVYVIVNGVFWNVGRTKHDIWRRRVRLYCAYVTIFRHFIGQMINWLIIKIIAL